MEQKHVVISGGSGLVGSLLTRSMEELGWDVRALTRGLGSEKRIHWDPANGILDAAALEGVDYVIHLAGENLAAGRWTPVRRERILQSRVQGTALLARTLAGLKRPPRVLLCASGSNIYPDNAGGSPWDEQAEPGEGFLAEVCQQWEAAAAPAKAAGIRVINARMGAVLMSKGGLLSRLVPSICLGLGAVLGTGEQRMSWIHADDLVRAYLHILFHKELEGPVNVVSPLCVSNSRLMEVMAEVLKRPLFFRLPEWLVRWLFGQMGTELLLVDNAVLPLKLLESGMQWEFAEIEDALAELLPSHRCSHTKRPRTDS